METDSIFRDPSPPAGPAGADGAPGPAGPAGPAGDPADLPQPLGVLDSPQFESLGVGTDPNLLQGIALDVAGGAIRVSNPEGDEVTKQWSLLTRPYDTDKLDCALFTAASRADSGVDSGVDLYIGGRSLDTNLPLNNIYFGTSSAYGTGVTPTRMMIDYLGNVVFGGASSLPDSTTRFLYIPSGNGAPSAAPAKTYVGRRPLYYDYAASRLYVYNDGAWRAVGTGTETVLPSVCDARLTLTTGVPVTTSDVIGASTIYLTRYQGAHVALWDGSAWGYHEVPSADVSLALSGLTDGYLYDVFCYDAAGTLTLSLSAAWADDVTRTDALAYQDGVRVLASDHTKRLVGTICATGADTTASSVNFRYVRNEAHPVPQVVRVLGFAERWSYGTNEFRVLNNDATCCIRYLSDGQSPLDVTAKLSYTDDSSTTVRQLAWAVDVVDKDVVYAAPGANFWDNRSLGNKVDYLSTRVPIMAAEGRHTVWPVERNNAATTAQYPGCNGVVLA